MADSNCFLIGSGFASSLKVLCKESTSNGCFVAPETFPSYGKSFDFPFRLAGLGVNGGV